MFYARSTVEMTFIQDINFRGPAIVLEKTSTLFVTPEFNCQIDNYGNIVATC